MKRTPSPLDHSDGHEGSGPAKRAKFEEPSDEDIQSPTPTRIRRKTASSEPLNAKSPNSRRSTATDSDSSASSKNTRSPTTKRSSARSPKSRSQKIESANYKANSRSPKPPNGPETEPLTVVPKYVDYFLLPGTTLTIHRKEFMQAEINFTAKTMAFKLSSKASRAIKRGEYTPRSQLPAGAPLMRPNKLCPEPTPLTQPIHPIALDLKHNRKEPPRPVLISE